MGGKNYRDFLILISVLLAQTLVFILVSIIFVITAFADEDKFQEGFQDYYNADLNQYGLVAYIVIINLLCGLIVFFTASLIWLHIKLKKWGLTAYEFIVYKDEKEERLERLKLGEITQAQFDEEEKQAMEDIRKKKKSKIIHQINKEDKKAYKQRIIERNRIAREQQKQLEEIKEKPTPEKPRTRDTNKEKDEFDDISKAQKPQRVQNYDIKKNESPIANVVEEKYRVKEEVAKSPKITVPPEKEKVASPEHTSREKINMQKSESVSSQQSLERQDLSSVVSKDSDLNDRDHTFKLQKDEPPMKKQIINNHVGMNEKQFPSDVSEESDNN